MSSFLIMKLTKQINKSQYIHMSQNVWKMISVKNHATERWYEKSCHWKISMKNHATELLYQWKIMPLKDDINEKSCHWKMISMKNHATERLYQWKIMPLKDDINEKSCHWKISVKNHAT